MIDAVEGGLILARLQAHFPNLGANDQAARDWLDEICSTPDPYPIVEWMIREWDRDRGPRVSDWVRARRTSVHQAQLAAGDPRRLELDAPSDPADEERMRSIVGQARDAISFKKAEERDAELARLREIHEELERRRPPEPASTRVGVGAGEGLAVRPLTYEEVYGPETPEEPPDPDPPEEEVSGE